MVVCIGPSNPIAMRQAKRLAGSQQLMMVEELTSESFFEMEYFWLMISSTPTTDHV
jgi:hypothetical protein